MSCEPPLHLGQQDKVVIDGQDNPLAALIDLMQQNWDQGDNAANDDVVVQIREHIRRQQEATQRRSLMASEEGPERIRHGS